MDGVGSLVPCGMSRQEFMELSSVTGIRPRSDVCGFILCRRAESILEIASDVTAMCGHDALSEYWGSGRKMFIFPIFLATLFGFFETLFDALFHSEEDLLSRLHDMAVSFFKLVGTSCGCLFMLLKCGFFQSRVSCKGRMIVMALFAKLYCRVHQFFSNTIDLLSVTEEVSPEGLPTATLPHRFYGNYLLSICGKVLSSLLALSEIVLTIIPMFISVVVSADLLLVIKVASLGVDAMVYSFNSSLSTEAYDRIASLLPVGEE